MGPKFKSGDIIWIQLELLKYDFVENVKLSSYIVRSDNNLSFVTEQNSIPISVDWVDNTWQLITDIFRE